MPALAYWFTGGALAAFLALVTTFVATTATLGYAWYRAAVTEQDSAASKLTSTAYAEKIRQVKSLLGKASRATSGLFKDTVTEEELTKDAEGWVNKTYDLIAAAYGDGEAALFMDNSGYIFYSDGSEKSKVRNWVDARARRLAELIPRTDRIAIRDDFDPKKFDY
jgi:hypothetical protein